MIAYYLILIVPFFVYLINQSFYFNKINLIKYLLLVRWKVCSINNNSLQRFRDINTNVFFRHYANLYLKGNSNFQKVLINGFQNWFGHFFILFNLIFFCKQIKILNLLIKSNEEIYHETSSNCFIIKFMQILKKIKIN